jgi:RNA polymerase nonessential primary-like sigma factor
LFDQAVSELGFAGRRQGVGRDAALQALPLEHKNEVVRWAIIHFRNHIGSSVAQGICRVAGLERFNGLEVDDVLSGRQWSRLRSELIPRLAQEHRRYKRAQQLLFSGYGHVVETVVSRIVFRSSQRADSLQEGALGLLAAIDRVDESGQEFAHYAAAWVRRRIRNHLMREKLPVHAPINLISRALAGARDGDRPELNQVNAEVQLLEFLRSPSVSLDEIVDDHGQSIAERLADETIECPAAAADRADLSVVVGHLLLALTEKQREVLAHRFGLGGTALRNLSETAREIGISHQQAGMRERRALQRLETVLQPLLTELTLEAAI